MLKLDEIHKAKDFRESEVAVPEWGGTVKCRTLSMAARWEIGQKSMNGDKVDNVKFAAGTMQHGLIEPVMTYDEAVKVINEHHPAPIQRIVDEVWRLSGLTEAVAKNA